MRHKLFLGAIAFLFAIGLHVTTIQHAQASAAEFFKCKLAEDATMEQLVTATEAFLAAAKENGHEGYSVRFLSPVFSQRYFTRHLLVGRCGSEPGGDRGHKRLLDQRRQQGTSRSLQ